MEPSWTKPGAIFRWSSGLSLRLGDDRPMRVLVRQGDIVLYDVWWPHLGNWGLADVKGLKRQRADYYVVRTRTLAGRATYVRSDPLTAEEQALHRPDLPFAAVQIEELSWPATTQASATWANDGWGVDRAEVALQAAEIYLRPFGPKGGGKTSVRVKADDGSAFTVRELIGKAAAIQAPHVGEVLPVQGIGIYREGLQRGIPTFYLWGAESRLRG